MEVFDENLIHPVESPLTVRWTNLANICVLVQTCASCAPARSHGLPKPQSEPENAAHYANYALLGMPPRSCIIEERTQAARDREAVRSSPSDGLANAAIRYLCSGKYTSMSGPEERNA